MGERRQRNRNNGIKASGVVSSEKSAEKAKYQRKWRHRHGSETSAK